MRTRLAIRVHAFLERHFPERRVFLRSDNDTRFIRLRPVTQIIAAAGGTMIVSWTIIATAILLMDSIGSGNYREQAMRDQATYRESLNSMAAERDLREQEALAAQDRFNAALERISAMQTELLQSEARRRELETGIDVIQATLRKTLKERDATREELLALQTPAEGGEREALPAYAEDTLNVLTAALSETAAERDQTEVHAQDALAQADEMAERIALMEDQNDAIFRQLEEAMTVSVEPLDKMFRAAGMNTDTLINQVRRGYTGRGGPMTPISFSTMGELPSPDAERANAILQRLEELDLYRLAAEKAPFAMPVHARFRYSSGFGTRRDPKTGGIRQHYGTDMAAPVGTPLYSAGDGVVTHAGWSTGYGRLVKIKHDFGIETRYAHMSRIGVKVGQRVSRGERIGDMGASGRVTGPHLHYEIRVGGKPVNPMIYIKAARDVF
ncbi:MAG: peptidoglycan DD-metalloendopeptidase family protein [Rhodobacteraceae bacterium]|nr:peptidoglycan DD-metalloendopeptidase family protein [Paracoccaceae bacterium]MBR9823249.1 peptidoglycan DD-metalloendopeptidase family protein [Paracoccaceae bacterium]